MGAGAAEARRAAKGTALVYSSRDLLTGARPSLGGTTGPLRAALS
jgi:hypothetical protein